MTLSDPSAVFLFSEYSGPSYDTYTLDKKIKSDITNMYEDRIKEFLNTWFIFSCKCNCCNKKTNETPSTNITKSITENTFMNIFGSKYYDNTLQFIIPRLLRFRHILKIESNPNYELSYSDYVKDSKILMKKVLSKTDDFLIRTRYKEIYMFYNTIIDNSNEELMNLLDDIVRRNVSKYIDTHSYEDGILPVIESSMFYNNSSYDSIREKALVIFFEIVCRFFDNINVDIYYSKENPTKQFLDGFFKIQKVININNIFYFFLRDSKSVLVYDLEDKLSSSVDSDHIYKGQKYTCVDNVRHIYLLSFDSKIVSMVYSDLNALLFLENGSIIANGNNANCQLVYDKELTNAVKFINFAVSSVKEISYVKIFNDHIIIKNDKNELFIHGIIDNTTNNELYNSSTYVKPGIYFNDHYKDKPFFSMSENESNIYFYDSEEVGRMYAFDNMNVFISDNSIIIDNCKVPENNLVLNHTIVELPDAPENYEINNFFKLKNDAFIVEISTISNETTGEKEYHSYYVNLHNGSNNLPLLESGFYTENVNEELGTVSYVINSGKIALLDNNANLQVSEIQQIISRDNKTIILYKNGVIAACGTNEGHFLSYPYDLEKFQIISSELPNKDYIYTGIEISKGSSKSLTLIYREDEALGYGGYHFLGMKYGSTFRNTDEEVKLHYVDTEIDGITNNKFYSYFCTKNCLFFINPIFDLIATGLLGYINYKDDAIGKVIGSLLYMKDMSVTYNEDAYEHIINNLTLETDDNPINSHHASQKLHANLQNFLNHDSVLLMYGYDDAKYNTVSKFINLIGLIAENFMAMKTTRCSLESMDFDDFVFSIEDINRKSIYKGEEKEYGIKFNPFRAR